jgi:hypothetical protein
MSEQIFYPQVQILHIYVVSYLWVEPINNLDNNSFYFLNNIIFFV